MVGDGGGSTPDFSLIPRLTFFNGSCLRWSFGFFDPRFFVNSKVDIFQWLLLEMVIWMEMTPDFSLIPRLTFFNGSCLRWSFGWKFFFFQYNKDVRPSVLYIIEVIHKEEVGGGFYIPNIAFFSILNVGCFFRAEIPAR